MDELPATWGALCALAFGLGLRHGFDADHLATIDGLARFNASAKPRLARAAGALFSLGHGAIVVAVALVAGRLAGAWETPPWLELAGTLVSVAFLFGLAAFNVRAVLRTPHDARVLPVGFRASLLARFTGVGNAWGVAAVGALFAVSFDTVSQAALFALAAARYGGAGHALALASLFVIGMVIIDGANGAWISRLVVVSNRTALVASRVMALAIAGIGFAVGGYVLAKIAVPIVAQWSVARDWAASAAVAGAALVAFAAGMIAARRRPRSA